jgi:hypothetical protein
MVDSLLWKLFYNVSLDTIYKLLAVTIILLVAFLFVGYKLIRSEI